MLNILLMICVPNMLPDQNVFMKSIDWSPRMARADPGRGGEGRHAPRGLSRTLIEMIKRNIIKFLT